MNADENRIDFHEVIQKYIVSEEKSDSYDPRQVFENETRSKDVETKISEHLQYLKTITKLDKALNRVGFVR